MVKYNKDIYRVLIQHKPFLQKSGLEQANLQQLSARLEFYARRHGVPAMREFVADTEEWATILDDIASFPHVKIMWINQIKGDAKLEEMFIEVLASGVVEAYFRGLDAHVIARALTTAIAPPGLSSIGESDLPKGQKEVSEDMIKSVDIIRFDKLQDARVLSTAIAKALDGSPLKGHREQLAKMVGERIVLKKAKLVGVGLPQPYVIKIVARIAKIPKMNAFMRVSKNNLDQIADVFANLIISELQKTRPEDYMERAQQEDVQPMAQMFATNRLLKLLQVNGWTPAEAMAFGWEYLLSHNFTPKDIYALKSMLKVGSRV